MAENYIVEKKQSWATFHSPLKILEISTGDSKILLDWNRDADHITINGKSIAQLTQEKKSDKEDYFKNLDALKSFFKMNLLQHLRQDRQAEALDYLMSRLHQGALLHPVSGATAKAISEMIPGRNLSAGSEGATRQVSFVMTKNGFKLQEIHSLKCLVDGDNDDSNGKPIQIVSDQPDQPIISAQATLDIDFSKPSENRITVENSSITYGNSEIQKLLDSRTLIQWIIDYISTKLGFNKSDDLSTVKLANRT